MFSIVLKYITGLLAVITITQGIVIYNYSEEVADMAVTLLLNDINERECNETIEMQNNAIIDLGLLYEGKIALYDEAMSDGSMIQYVNRYMETPDENNTECETVINILDNIGRIGL